MSAQPIRSSSGPRASGASTKTSCGPSPPWSRTGFNERPGTSPPMRACACLDTFNPPRPYQAGDLWGCLGVWSSGRWYDSGAMNYINRVQSYLSARIWENADVPERVLSICVQTARPRPTPTRPTRRETRRGGWAGLPTHRRQLNLTQRAPVARGTSRHSPRSVVTPGQHGTANPFIRAVWASRPGPAAPGPRPLSRLRPRPRARLPARPRPPRWQSREPWRSRSMPT